MDPSSDRGKVISGSPQANIFDPNSFRDNYGSLTSDTNTALADMLMDKQVFTMADILPSNPSALECLEKALELFRLLEVK